MTSWSLFQAKHLTFGGVFPKNIVRHSHIAIRSRSIVYGLILRTNRLSQRHEPRGDRGSRDSPSLTLRASMRVRRTSADRKACWEVDGLRAKSQAKLIAATCFCRRRVRTGTSTEYGAGPLECLRFGGVAIT